ncbi:glycosyltransferase family 4 protein [Actinomyces dentalis]|uniref:glycosyltransferase family 4 protein n=1 Tax=Actinomyces dentalis TaxID=272548 RepID=UPI0003F5ABE9|nr:glycosyltransferase [Actinomyces dentalis]
MRARRRRIGFIGRIDPDETMVDGQTVKTRTLYRYLVRRFGASNIRVADTRDYRRETGRVVRELLRCLHECDDVVVLLSSGGRRTLFPILWLASTALGVRIYHDLIGGSLADDVEADPSGLLVHYLNSFEVNWVETRALADRLSALGVRNASHLPNFKDVDDVDVDPHAPPSGPPYRLCTLSRVTPEKGIDNAVRAVAAINGDGPPMVTLDVFGPIEPSYEERFRRLVDSVPHVRYAGRVPPERAAAAVSGHFALIFPTEWTGEGVPGTIIDAMHAGLPVVASRWRYYHEMLQDGVTGLSYDFDRPELLEATIRELLALPDEELAAMRRATLERARAYAPEAVFDEIARALARPAKPARAAGGAGLAKAPGPAAPAAPAPGPAAAAPSDGVRVMIVIHGLETGGAEMMVLHLARELSRAGHPVRVVSLHGDDTDVAGLMRRAGVDVVALNKAGGPDPRTVLRLRAQMRDFSPAVVHTHLPVLEYVLPAVRLYGRRVKVIHTVHNIAREETRHRVLREVNRLAFSHGVVPVALNEEVRSSICREYALPPSAVPVVGNGIDLDAFRGPQRRGPRGAGARLLCVARLAPAKNHALLLRTVARLRESGRDVSLTLVGDGPLRGALEERARELGISERVRFAGRRTDTAAFYRDCDLFVLLSDYEGMPMSIIEAMASGLPVVATRAGGVAELVDDGVNGALVEADAAAAAGAIAAICDDPALYARLSAGAVRTSSPYSAEAMMEKYVDLYR